MTLKAGTLAGFFMMPSDALDNITDNINTVAEKAARELKKPLFLQRNKRYFSDPSMLYGSHNTGDFCINHILIGI